MSDAIEPLAPVYRYFTADILTNKILMEIPFRGVSYELAIKAAGKFDGKIPAIPANESLDLYNSTMPGQTALYVVRDGVCVWGGIIWSREIDTQDNDLRVSASEFTSYFYHRRVWKTWSHQYGAHVSIANGVAGVFFDTGTTSALSPGASVKLEFYDPKDFRYNGYYKIDGTPSPTTDQFYISGAQSEVDIISVERSGVTVTVRTKSSHGLSTGDTVTIDIDSTTNYNGAHVISAPGGTETDRFSFTLAGDASTVATVVGVATRPLPAGEYSQVTVSVRADTYDYVRSLVEAVFADFVGIDFPNEYIEPGISYGLGVDTRQILGGFATITTSSDHNLAVGQAVQIENVGPLYDGEVAVTDTPTTSSFRYKRTGNEPIQGTPTLTAVITQRSAANGVATVTTSAAHGFSKGQSVILNSGYNIDGQGALFNGTRRVTAVPTPTTFRYAVDSLVSVPATVLPNPTATVGAQVKSIIRRDLAGNVVTISTSAAHGYAVGNSVAIAGVGHTVPIVQKSLDAASSTATITTTMPHQLSTGDSVSINGIRDSSKIITRRVSGSTAAKSVTLGTQSNHNFYVGNTINISDLDDEYSPVSRSVASNVATVTFSGNHNIPVASNITVSNILDRKSLASISLADGIATVTASGLSHAVNDVVTIKNVNESAIVVSKEVVRGIAVLTTATPHNFQAKSTIVVSGVNETFNGTYQVLSVTPTRVLFDTKATWENFLRKKAAEYQALAVQATEARNALLRSQYLRAAAIYLARASAASLAAQNQPPTQSSGTVTSDASIFNGSFAVSSASPGSASFVLSGNSFTTIAPTATFTPVISGPSALNGTHAVTGVTATTITFSKTTPNLGTTAVIIPEGDNPALPLVSLPSVHLESRVLTSVTANSVTFSQTLPQASPIRATTTGSVSAASVFNGTYNITVASIASFTYTKSGRSNVFETATNSVSYLSAPSLFNGSYAITAVNSVANTFSYARTHADVVSTQVDGRGVATVKPSATVSTFGPYPGNADIGVDFSTAKYSGVSITPKPFRGFQLTNAGEALNSYSDSIDGFEYRIDCAFDVETNSFSRTFVLLPINFPDPPAPGEVSPVSRFGADRLVFELPGNIINVALKESAEDSATRFFTIGETDLGADAGPPFSVASADDMLNGTLDRRWPLLDEDEKVDADDETVLYAYAKRYLNESRPPNASISVSVNGSLQPEVGSYHPGDWCSLIVDSDFIRMRLASDLEPRDTVIVRKIDAISVSVPDGSTFPERVQLTLVPEWEVDKRG